MEHCFNERPLFFIHVGVFSHIKYAQRVVAFAMEYISANTLYFSNVAASLSGVVLKAKETRRSTFCKMVTLKDDEGGPC